ncbi:MAG: hypothetical protein QM642_00205 [Edaphocola sp.]
MAFRSRLYRHERKARTFWRYAIHPLNFLKTKKQEEQYLCPANSVAYDKFTLLLHHTQRRNRSML